jgi:hypothetical protein
VEVEIPPSGVSKTKGSRDSERGPPLGDITRKMYKIKLLEFVRGCESYHVEAWLEGMTRCFSLRNYASTSKANVAIFQLRDNSLNWWGNMER